MNIKRLIKRIAPPILVDMYRRNFREPIPEPIWEGVYQHFRDVLVSGPGFDGDVWVSESRTYTEALLAASKKGPIPEGGIRNHTLLSLLASVICNSQGRVRILDFGGGMGVTYLQVISNLVKCGSVEYHIIENASICEAGKRLFENDGRIYFHTRLPDNLTEVDIIFTRGAMQYIEDYKWLIDKLTDYNPVYFLYDALPAGNIPTYATAQRNVKGSVIPCWFLNLDEILDAMATRGYVLIFKGVSEQKHDQSNFPEEYRQESRTCLLFAKA
jgi:putative methyltransferase (TIGR04325 family)